LRALSERSYKATGDAKATWLEVVNEVDTINAFIAAGDTDAPSDCHCADAQMKESSEHFCSRCARAVVCAKRVQAPSGLFMCPSCIAFCRFRFYSGASQKTAVQQYNEHSLLTNLSSDAKAVGLKESSPKFIGNRDNCIAFLARTAALQPSPSTWRSAATGIVHTFSTSAPTTWKKNPDDSSIDAIFPVGEYNGMYFVHCDGNLWNVEQCVNFLKHDQIPAFIVLVSSNLNWHDQAGPDSNFEQQEAIVISKATTMAAIRVKWAYWRKTRVKTPFNAEHMAADREEQISGKLRSNEPGPWAKRNAVQRYIGRGSLANLRAGIRWSDDVIGRLEAAAQRYLQRFHLVLQERDGCVMICDGPVPDEYGWPLLCQILDVRAWRFLNYCNRGCPTEDTPGTIYIFCIILICIIKCDPDKLEPDDKALVSTWRPVFTDFLRLPVLLDIRNGICFAISHLVHGRQMLSGVDPLTFEWTPNLCNILRESRSSNYVKHNYDPRHYDRILDIIRQINIEDKAIFDQSIKPGPRQPNDQIRDVTVEEVEDEWNKNDFTNDAVFDTGDHADDDYEWRKEDFTDDED